MIVWLLEIVTGALRRYMNVRIGNGFVNEAFSHADAARITARTPHAVRAFDAVQEVIFA